MTQLSRSFVRYYIYCNLSNIFSVGCQEADSLVFLTAVGEDMREIEMKQSIGIDIVEIGRISDLLSKYGERFIHRVLCREEEAILRGRIDRSRFLAGRFAAKEATIKALGLYITDRPPLRLLRVLSDESGQPRLEFGGELSETLRSVSTLVSISHEKTHAVAVVLLTGGL